MRLESEEENIRELAPTGIRIPTKLKQEIKSAAKKNNRSMNAEVVARLQSTVEADENNKIIFESLSPSDDIDVERSDYEKLMNQISEVMLKHFYKVD